MNRAGQVVLLTNVEVGALCIFQIRNTESYLPSARNSYTIRSSSMTIFQINILNDGI